MQRTMFDDEQFILYQPFESSECSFIFVREVFCTISGEMLSFNDIKKKKSHQPKISLLGASNHKISRI